MNGIARAAALLACVATGCTPVPQQAEPFPTPEHGPAAASATPTAVIPPRFRGEWNGTPAGCDPEQPESRLTLSADRVAFGERAGPVQSVTRHHDDEIGIAVQLSDEGERWTAHHRFRLSRDGLRLADTGSGGRVRHRCR